MTMLDRFNKYHCAPAGCPLTLDVSRMNFEDDFLDRMAPSMERAFKAMDELEAGAIANPDEGRMVGHYWLRDADRAPNADIASAIRRDLAAVDDFAARVHSGQIAPASGGRFENLLVIGIGGSALGPQLLADALRDPATDRMRPYFFDNTDPDGMARTLREIGAGLGRTLFVVISKSGGTPEPRNGMLVAEAACRAAGLTFARQAVAVTGEGSQLDRYAANAGFLARFPMYDWVGGRTSLWCTVGTLPAALQGLDTTALLDGARRMDEITRRHDTRNNPAALMALMWHHATGGRGEKDMVVLPYADRLLLFSRYLQQLVMESLGKEKDLAGKVVHQGIAVYGNKGSTDQHAYVQQLRDGVPNFFATFVEVLHKEADGLEVEPGVTSGDYLNGFLLGTREALHGNGRESMTITLPRLDASTLGALIALFERAVGFYASLVGINAYHQPGVEAGKKAAARVLALQAKALACLQGSKDARSAEELASEIGAAAEAETLFLTLRHLAANRRGVAMEPDGRFRAL